MVGLFSLTCTIALLTAAAASPLERRDTILQCVQGGKISSDNAQGIMNQAPFAAGRSGYPHTFTNAGKLQLNPRCYDNGVQKELQEAPVFEDLHVYNFDSKPKDNPGPARVVYTKNDKIFCGVISHTEPDNGGDFALCNPA